FWNRNLILSKSSMDTHRFQSARCEDHLVEIARTFKYRWVRTTLLRWVSICACGLGWAFLSVVPADALVVTTPTLDTTQPPADYPGWNNVTQGGGRNFSYMVNGWALSAYHFGPNWNTDQSQQQLTFSTGTFQLIPYQNYTVPNPSGSGLTALTDLRLV